MARWNYYLASSWLSSSRGDARGDVQKSILDIKLQTYWNLWTYTFQLMPVQPALKLVLLYLKAKQWGCLIRSELTLQKYVRRALWHSNKAWGHTKHESDIKRSQCCQESGTLWIRAGLLLTCSLILKVLSDKLIKSLCNIPFKLSNHTLNLPDLAQNSLLCTLYHLRFLETMVCGVKNDCFIDLPLLRNQKYSWRSK